MAEIKKIKNSSIITISGAPGKSIKVDTEGLGKSVDDAELYHQPGVFSRPVDETQGVNLDVKGLNIIIATHDYKLDKSLDKGEVIIYSIDADGNILASILLNNASEVVVNDGTDYAVAFNNLKTEFDKLNDEYNKLITRMLAWTPVPNDGGAALKTAITNAPTCAVSGSNIDNSKVEKVRLP